MLDFLAFLIVITIHCAIFFPRSFGFQWRKLQYKIRKGKQAHMENHEED